MLKKTSYILGLLFFVLFAILIFGNSGLNGFVDSIENKTFDLRQNLAAKSKTPSPNIAIITVDDASYEYILDTYGEWPLPRDVYAKIVNYLEKQNVETIAFDLLFVKSMKSKPEADKALVEAITKNDNVYTAINFDNQPDDMRLPPALPDRLALHKDFVEKNINLDDLTFTNCRAILPEIMNGTSNIGVINVSRADDGILRNMPVVVKYKDKYYPQLALKIAMKHYPVISINKNSANLFETLSKTSDPSRKIYTPAHNGNAILNWYGPAQTFETIPLYKVIKVANGEKTDLKYNFQDKTVFIGTSVASLGDIKSVPTDKLFPGVEVQATYLNNILDNNFIQKAPVAVTVLVGLLIAALIAYAVLALESALAGTLITLFICADYLVIAYLMMRFGNVWLDIVQPTLLAILAFICALIVKYLIKSRDFDRQYKLATTDGLTELYNHRYFQEQMKMNVEQSKRYENPFSLIIVDIDYFKKFNDTFGHQAGDAVLRQVAFMLKRNVRATDIVCRYGGEEMSIILPNTNAEAALTTAKLILERIEDRTFKLSEDKEGKVTVSAGVATFPQDGETAVEIIEAADKRLYSAKNSGRNQVKGAEG